MFKDIKLNITLVLFELVFILNIVFNNTTSSGYKLYMTTSMVISIIVLLIIMIKIIIKMVNIIGIGNRRILKKKDVITIDGLQYIKTVEYDMCRYIITNAKRECYLATVIDGKVVELVKNPPYRMITHRPKQMIVTNNINSLVGISNDTSIEQLFEEGPRFHKQTPLYVLYGDSGAGKSWFGTLLVKDHLVVCETDLVDNKEEIHDIDFTEVDVIVLGNKHKMKVDELDPLLPNGRDIIKIDFRKDYK